MTDTVYALSYDYIGGRSAMSNLFKSVEGAKAFVVDHTEGYGEIDIKWEWDEFDEDWVGKPTHYGASTVYRIRSVKVMD